MVERTPIASVPQQAVQYQSDLLMELVEEAETNANLSSAEAETLRHRIEAATSEQDIATVWAELDGKFRILDEDQWAH